MTQINRLSQFERPPKIKGHIELKTENFICAVISKVHPFIKLGIMSE